MTDVDDPFKPPSDATVVRPRPGGGRRPAGSGPPGGSPPSSRGPTAPLPDAGDPLPRALEEIVSAGLNPLVRAAAPLLVLMGRIRGTVTGDVASLRQHALDAIQRFEERARKANVPNELVLPARYALCAGIDEAVLSTPWGSHSEWGQRTLLIVLHREAWGGEKFFDMLDRSCQDPRRFIDLMELQYLCLALGFVGKYHDASRGGSQLATVQQSLYRKIRESRGAPENELSPRWRGIEDRRNPVFRYVPWWVVAAAAFAVLAVAYTLYLFALNRLSAPVYAELARVGLEDFAEALPPPAATGPTLKQLLAPQERQGVLVVDEDGARTRVRVLAENLFASGSAAINPASRATLQAVAAAIRQVPGRVLVEGHTDDQPIQSGRYRDNTDLSQHRAENVAAVLKAAIDSPARIVFTGLGSSQPRFTPPSEPQNRARNRRVEIVHLYGS